ncbi:MAG: hypothetical protein NTW49_05620 [Bacteroidia bacterium]|nr:hypothetical protein [Bacteroidia bacterium]
MHRRYCKIFLIVILLFTFCRSVQGQSDVNLKLKTFSYLVNNFAQPDLLKLKLDKQGILVAEPGFIVSYDFFVRDLVYSLRVDQAVYLDAASHLAGYTNFGVHVRIFNKWKNSVNIGAGTAFHYRHDWHNIAGYQNTDGYDNSGRFEYHLSFLTGSIEFNHYFNERNDLSFALSECYPDRIVFSAGYRWWLSKKIRHTGGCNTCPKF